MIPLGLGSVARVLGARIVPGDGMTEEDAALLEIAGVMTDTRIRAERAALFFALRTDRADGHDHVDAAAGSGAVAAVVEREESGRVLPQLVVADGWDALGRLGRHVVDGAGCRVVAITGSYGKTTAKDLTAAALSAGRRVTASRASFNNELGVPLTMLDVSRDTEVLVAEAGARNAGDLGAMAGLLRPDVSVVTAVGPVHLETFGDEDGVAAEKGRLVTALREDGVAVLNGDDARVAAMAAGAPSALLVRASGAAADVWVEEVSADELGRARATAHTPWGITRIEVPLPGPHHLTNALLALCVAGVEGVPVDAAAAAIARATTSPSRSALHRVAGVTVMDDAYNASPPTVLAALTTLRALPCEGRRWAVLGVMAELGEGSDRRHREVGAAYAARVDELVVVGAAAAELAAGARGASGTARVREVADHAEAARLVAGEVTAGDAVLLKASRVAGLDRTAAALIEALRGAVAR
jgi:UDP-N-acetylmuramoyl-tripeptide--D-alanyl-D-alanine ligase